MLHFVHELPFTDRRQVFSSGYATSELIGNRLAVNLGSH